VEQAKGKTIEEVCRSWGSSNKDVLSLAQRIRWAEAGPGQAIKEMEKEKRTPEELVADLSLDKAILKEAASETSEPGKRRAAVVHVRDRWARRGLERRACQVLGQPRLYSASCGPGGRR